MPRKASANNPGRYGQNAVQRSSQPIRGFFGPAGQSSTGAIRVLAQCPGKNSRLRSRGVTGRRNETAARRRRWSLYGSLAELESKGRRFAAQGSVLGVPQRYLVDPFVQWA